AAWKCSSTASRNLSQRSLSVNFGLLERVAANLHSTESEPQLHHAVEFVFRTPSGKRPYRDHGLRGDSWDSSTLPLRRCEHRASNRNPAGTRLANSSGQRDETQSQRR